MAKRRGNNEGSIYKRESGKWIAQVRINGKRFAKSHDTQGECQEWIRDMRRQIDDGFSINGTRLTVATYLEQWLKDIKETIRPKTHYQYTGAVRNHLVPRLGNRKLLELRANHVQAFYAELLADGKSKRTVQLVHSVLHRAIVVAYKHGLVGQNVVSKVDPPKPAYKEMMVLNDNQARELLIAARGHRYEALFHIAVTTGLRQGELLGLKWEDLDWSSGSLQVKRQLQRVPSKGLVFSELKTQASRRSIQLGAGSLAQLSEHRKKQEIEKGIRTWQENGLIFPSSIGTPLGHRNMLRTFKQLLKTTGLPDVRFHDLRHTAATLMLLNGIPLIIVSRRLGHSKPSVTLDIYGHYLPGMQRQAADLMDEIVTPIQAEWQQIATERQQLNPDAS